MGLAGTTTQEIVNRGPPFADPSNPPGDGMYPRTSSSIRPSPLTGPTARPRGGRRRASHACILAIEPKNATRPSRSTLCGFGSFALWTSPNVARAKELCQQAGLQSPLIMSSGSPKSFGQIVACNCSTAEISGATCPVRDVPGHDDGPAGPRHARKLPPRRVGVRTSGRPVSR